MLFNPISSLRSTLTSHSLQFQVRGFSQGGRMRSQSLTTLTYGNNQMARGARMTFADSEKIVPDHLSMQFASYPPVVGSLGEKYLLRDTTNPVGFFQFSDMKARPDTAIVCSTDPRMTRSRTIQKHLSEHTRGYAAQIVLEGRGVRASFEPAWPMLTVRVGNGVKAMDVSRLVRRFPGEARVSITPKGDAMTVHGYNKNAVAQIAIRLFKYVRLNQYTGKGGYLLAHPLQKRKSKKA